jgi:hypothetical protein
MTPRSDTQSAAALLTLLVLGSTAGLNFASCTGPEADYEDRLAFVTHVSVPDTVQIGESFLVSISTGTPSGAWKKGRDDVRAIEVGYRIVPYDQAPTGSGPIQGDIGRFTHEVILRLNRAGMAEIQIRHRLASTSGRDSTGTMVREVVVLSGEKAPTD